MRTKPTLLSALLLASATVTTAYANWFSNPTVNIDLNLGSAPNPTSNDILTERVPVLVRDADGNVIAMIDPSGKIIATAEPQAAPKPANTAAPPAQSSRH